MEEHPVLHKRHPNLTTLINQPSDPPLNQVLKEQQTSPHLSFSHHKLSMRHKHCNNDTYISELLVTGYPILAIGRYGKLSFFLFLVSLFRTVFIKALVSSFVEPY